MRINLLILTYILLMTIPAAAQFYEPDTPFGLGSPPFDGLTVPIGSDAGLASLERAIAMGDRRASALLAVLLQDSPDVENSLVRSAIYFQVAIVAGCSDLEVLTATAVARLSPDELASYQTILPFWIPASGTQLEPPHKGPCLSW